MAKLKVRKLDSKTNRGLHLGLFIKSSLIGFILAIPSHANSIKIDDLQLEKEFHGLGYDELLIEEVEKAASETGVSKIIIEILPHAYPYYKSLGFSLEGDRFTRDGIEYRNISKLI